MITTTKRKNDIVVINPEISEPIQLRTAMEIEGDRLATKMGAELMDEVVKEPTLDRYLDGNPKIIMPNYEEMVALLQKKRALFITSEQKKKEPKIEGDESEIQD